MTDSIQIHWLTAYPASCLVRGADGRPKTLSFGGVDRGRISSASLKRAVRVSDAFSSALDGHLGRRTSRVGEIVRGRLVEAGVSEAKAISAAKRVASAFGKIDEKNEANTSTAQLAYISPEEVDAATSLATRIAGGESVDDDDLRKLLFSTTTAVDIGLFGRMFADRGELRMRAACEVSHPFTVGRALLESDYYVAKDDDKPPSEDLGAGFIGEQYFLSGLFYGYARVDLDQMTRNLGGNRDLAIKAIKAFIEGVATVSPTGKQASFGTHARASWLMLERGEATPRSLAVAFLKPVKGEDPMGEAVERAEALTHGFDRAYGDEWARSTLNVQTGKGSLVEALALCDAKQDA